MHLDEGVLYSTKEISKLQLLSDKEMEQVVVEKRFGFVVQVIDTRSGGSCFGLLLAKRRRPARATNGSFTQSMELLTLDPRAHYSVLSSHHLRQALERLSSFVNNVIENLG